MRKTMFRGKNETNGQWYEGDFITDTNEFNRTCDKAFILPHWDKLNWPISVIEETVGEFTGLKDTTQAKDVFSGDIVEAINRNYEHKVVVEVTYLNGCFMFGNWNAHEFYNKHQFIKVIGNIHDHSHLLEEVQY